MTADVDVAEDVLQETCTRALESWSADGIPKNPGAWMNTVSRRIAIDRFRRERSVELPAGLVSPVAINDEDLSGIDDDTLRLMFVCCHPALSADAQCALALKLLGGLTTREIARAFVEPEATTAQRIVRAKKKIREAAIPFEIPSSRKLEGRIDNVHSVLYLIFNEGYVGTDSESLTRPDLSDEAIRLTRLAVTLLPESAETIGLLALMLLTDARRVARTSAEGELVPLEQQDRTRWDRKLLDEGAALLERALRMGRPGPYQIQAAIAALHGEALDPSETDWRQIALLYRTLLEHDANPVVELNAAIAHGMAFGPREGLQWVEQIERRGELNSYHLLPAAKAELLRRSGDSTGAARGYREAISLATSAPEKRYLETRLAELSDA